VSDIKDDSSVIMLIYVISLILQLPLCVNILNLCSNIKLVSPIYFGNGVVCPKLSRQQIDIGAKTNASFEINATQDEFAGALLFKLQSPSNDRCNMDASVTETDENDATRVYMLAAWGVKDSKFYLYVVLIENAKEFTWDKSKLMKLYYENYRRLREYNDITSCTWLIDGSMTLKTSFKVRSIQENFELSISISEEEKDAYAVLICISLALKLPVLLSIHNQCQCINLLSPVHFMYGGKWHIVPDQEIDANTVMRNCIEFDSGQSVPNGALVYRIQRRHAESDKIIQDESKNLQLMLTLGGKYASEFNVRVLLVEHDKEFNQNEIWTLCEKYWILLNLRPIFIRSTWLLDDATMLTTTVKAMDGGYGWNVFISEARKDSYIMRPLWLDAER
jgi:hypothetical protein